MLYVIKREKTNGAGETAVHWLSKAKQGEVQLPHPTAHLSPDRDQAREFTQAEATLAWAEIQRKKPGTGRFSLLEATPKGKVLSTHGTAEPDAVLSAVEAGDVPAGVPTGFDEVSTSVAGYATVESQPDGSPFIALAVAVGEKTVDGPNLDLTLDGVAAAAVDLVRKLERQVADLTARPLEGVVNGITFGVDGSDAFAHYGPNIMDGTAAFEPVAKHPSKRDAVLTAVMHLVAADGHAKGLAAAKLATPLPATATTSPAAAPKPAEPKKPDPAPSTPAKK